MWYVPFTHYTTDTQCTDWEMRVGPPTPPQSLCAVPSILVVEECTVIRILGHLPSTITPIAEKRQGGKAHLTSFSLLERF